MISWNHLLLKSTLRDHIGLHLILKSMLRDILGFCFNMELYFKSMSESSSASVTLMFVKTSFGYWRSVSLAFLLIPPGSWSLFLIPMEAPVSLESKLVGILNVFVFQKNLWSRAPMEDIILIKEGERISKGFPVLGRSCSISWHNVLSSNTNQHLFCVVQIIDIILCQYIICLKH